MIKTETRKMRQIVLYWQGGNISIGTFRNQTAQTRFLNRYGSEIEHHRPTFVDHIMGREEISEYLGNIVRY